jgi:hypothetical protein
MKAFFCELILSCVLAAPGAKSIDELTYGTMLYDFYQRDYQQALLDTLVAQAQGRQGEDTIRFELAKGSFAFSDGMYGYADATFSAVDPNELTQLDRMRLAFHLARVFQRREDWPALAEQLEKIDLGRTWTGREKFHPEVEYMRSELAVQRGEFGAAERALEKLDAQDPLRAYGLFNLGVAHRSAGNLDAAAATFGQLADLEAYSEEAEDLIQRAKLALAFIARQQHSGADAAQVLGALPGEGRYRDVAMAAYGGLAMDNGDYELAARIWLTLQNQDYWSSSTAQARLGFPISLEKLASQDMALVQYRAAERSFENRLASLTNLSHRAEDSAWVRGLLLVFSSPEQNKRQMSELMDRWRDQLGHTDWLEWLATEDTHQVLLEWRELLGMQDWLDQLPATLAAFEELTSEQHRRSAGARALLYDEALLANRDALREQTIRQTGRLAELNTSVPVRSVEWMMHLASPAERKDLLQLASMREPIKLGMANDEQARWLHRVDRLEGVLFWRLVDERGKRTRVLQKQLQANGELVSEVNARIARVQGAEAQFSAGVETDFLLFATRAQEITRSVDGALNSREMALAAELSRGLNQERKEVQQYLLITRIAIARATDQLAVVDMAEGD